jgi:hypothetical protein
VDDLHEEITKVAYELFERDGRQHGLDKEHWLEAERIVKARRKAKSEAKVPKKKASPQPTGVKKTEGQKEKHDPQKTVAGSTGEKAKRKPLKPGKK